MPRLLRPGTEVDGYTLEEVLGTGGMGAVYRARRGGRVHALKLLWLEHVGGRAEREAVLLLSLKHRNVVGFRGCGYWPEESPRYFYLAMEYVEGQPLDVWAEAERPGAREVARKVLHVARALEAVHAVRAVHRDVKEANILVRREDGEAVLVDFGAGGYEGAPRLTLAGLPPGTPDYRAPEAWRFNKENAGNRRARYVPGPRDDLYALGVVLYRLLARMSPRVDPADGQDAGEAYFQRRPVPPRTFNPRVPPELNEVCLALLEPQPERRTPDAKSVREALEDLLSRADASWDLPLHEWGGSSPPEPASVAVARPRVVVRREPRWRAAVMALVVATGICASLVGVLWPRSSSWNGRFFQPIRRVATGPAARNERSFQPTPREAAGVEPRREVAAPQAAPEAARAAAPHIGDLTSAAVTTPVARSMEEASVKQPNTPRSLLTATCMGLGTACASAPQLQPPPPEQCPPGAVEAMESMDIALGDIKTATLHIGPEVGPVLVREGSATLRVLGSWGGMPDRTMLSGRLYFGEQRIYGRFTEAVTPDKRRHPVCLEVWDTRGGRGAAREPGDGPGTARVYSTVHVYAVARFD
ncbi:serine/threonine-protein kinase [Pyxidicoccus sp. 3LG]